MSKVYLPEEFINSNYKYEYIQMKNTIPPSIVVKTDEIFASGSNNTKCYLVFTDEHYLVEGPYSCNPNQVISGTNGLLISYTQFTSDIFYRNDMPEILLMTFILLIILFYFPFRIISRMFGRWLKL